MRARSAYYRRHSKKKIDLRTTCPELSYVCHTYALNVLLCGPKIRNKDSCIYLTTTCMKERGMGGVGTMIGTSASKWGWSGRGTCEQEWRGWLWGKGSCKRTVLPIKIGHFLKIPPLFKRSGGWFQCVEQGIPIRWH